MSNLLISMKCVNLAKSFEGFVSTIYNDPVGIPTLGYGMTGDLIAGLTYVTESQASTLLENLLNNNYATPIKADLDSRKVVLNQNQLDAIVCMSYNIGVGGLLGSTLYKNIVNGVRDIATISADFQAWSKGNGVTIAGLLRRRISECNLFFNTSFATPNIPVAIPPVILYRKSVKIVKDCNAINSLGSIAGTFKVGNIVTVINEEKGYYWTTIGKFPIVNCELTTKTVTVTADVLNCRKSPVTGDVIKTFKKGDILTYVELDFTKKWGKLVTNKFTGWICLAYTK